MLEFYENDPEIAQSIVYKIMEAAKMTKNFAQGARCGHLEGKSRVGQYVMGEEFNASYEASEAQGFETKQLGYEWAAGYRHGYLKACEGEPLEVETVSL